VALRGWAAVTSQAQGPNSAGGWSLKVVPRAPLTPLAWPIEAGKARLPAGLDRRRKGDFPTTPSTTIPSPPATQRPVAMTVLKTGASWRHYQATSLLTGRLFAFLFFFCAQWVGDGRTDHDEVDRKHPKCPVGGAYPGYGPGVAAQTRRVLDP